MKIRSGKQEKRKKKQKNYKNRKFNPLVFIWSWLQAVFTVIVFSSFVQDAFKGLFEWKSFLSIVIEGYRQISILIFSWMPFNFTQFTKDYLIIGTLVTTAVIASYVSHFTGDDASKFVKGTFDLFRDLRPKSRSPIEWIMPLVVLLGFFGSYVLVVVIWPSIVIQGIFVTYTGRSLTPWVYREANDKSTVMNTDEEAAMWKYFLQWLASSILIATLLIVVNSQL